MISNKAAYMNDETWEKVVKLVAPGIRKVKVINVACVLNILLYIYLTIHICPSKYLQMICYLPKWWPSLTYDGLKSCVNVTEGIFFLHRRGSRLGSRRLGQVISIKHVINSWQIRTSLRQGISWIYHSGSFMDISPNGSSS